MEKEDMEAMAPIIYAALRAIKSFNEGYREAIEVYKKLEGTEPKNLEVKNAEDFIKNYNKFITLFALAKKLFE